MFGYTRENKINVVHVMIQKKIVCENNLSTIKPKIDLTKLPPSIDNLKPHIYHVNHHIAI